MKVLEKGPGWSLECKCTGFGHGDAGCGARLLVEKDDIFLRRLRWYDGSVDWDYYIQCPECHELTNIDDDKVPSSIKDKLLAEEREKLSRMREEQKTLFMGR